MTGRPSRRRKSVHHYTDDNPSTFTVKRKKGDPEPVAGDTGSRRGPTATTSTTTASVKRRLTKKPRNAGASSGDNNGRRSSSSSLTTAVAKLSNGGKVALAGANGSISISKISKSGTHQLLPSHSTAAAASSTASSTRASPNRLSKRKRVVTVATAPQNNPMPATDQIMCHAVQGQAVLPVHFCQSQTNSTSSTQWAARYPTVYHRTLPVEPPHPLWKQVTTNTTATLTGIPWIDTQTTTTSSSLLSTSATVPPPALSTLQLLAPPPITCFSVTAGTHVAVGDSAGGVWLFHAAAAVHRPWHCIQTTSAAIREQARTITSKRVIRYPNAVQACQWYRRRCSYTGRRWRSSSNSMTRGTTATTETIAEHVVLVWTVDELECLVLQDDDNDHNNNDNHSPQRQQAWKTAWRIPLVPVWAKGPAAMSPSLLDYTCWGSSGTGNSSSSSSNDHSSNTVLWTCQGRVPADVTAETQAVSLYRLQWNSEESDKVDKINRQAVVPVLADSKEPLKDWTCLTAIWDGNDSQALQQKNDDSRCILLVGQSPSQPDQWDLMRVADGTFQIQQQTAIEGCGRAAAAGFSVTLQQHGAYTFLSSHKGIRLYDNADLTLLQIYGDSVQLHGKTVTWQSALWIPAPVTNTGLPPLAAVAETAAQDSDDDDTVVGVGIEQRPLQVVRTSVGGGNKKPQAWLERTNELAYRDSWAPSTEYWLIGIPHPSKGPTELNSTLYVWKPGQAQAVTTLQAPAGGLLGVSGVSDYSGWRLLSATFDPNCMWEWRATMQSDFAGVMYPVGYQVINDNLEYIEDEDELDQAVVILDEEHGEEDDDDTSVSADEAVDKDLAVALRLSLLEQQKKKSADEAKENIIVSVLLDADDDRIHEEPIPCWPDPSLQEQLLLESGGYGGIKCSPVKDSPKKNSFVSEVLSALPEFKLVKRQLMMNREQEMGRKSPAPNEETASNSSALPAPKPKNKRSRMANVEALLQASIDPDLRQKMVCLHKQWGDGSKSALRKEDIGGSSTEMDNSTSNGNAADVIAKPKNGGAQTSFASAESTAISSPAKNTSALLPKDAAGTQENTDAIKTRPAGVDKSEEKQDTDSKPSAIAIVTTASAEEKELALELLMLSPTKVSLAETDVSRAPSMVESNGQKASVPEASKDWSQPLDDSDSGKEEGTAVSPTNPSSPLASGAPVEFKKIETPQNQPEGVRCAACRGRMVIHSCGAREKPVDYEAIARVEKEMKEKEEAGKQRIRTEKRRAAEAKRREARRKKKEEDELKMRETQERMRRLEAGQFEQAHIREHEEEPLHQPRMVVQNQQQGEWTQEGYRPALSPLRAHGGQTVHAYPGPVSSQAQVSHGFEQERHYYHEEPAHAAHTMTQQTVEAPQGRYYQYSETPLPDSSSTVQTWDGQQYPPTGFAKETYYDRPQSSPPSASAAAQQAWHSTGPILSVPATHDSMMYRSESAPPFATDARHAAAHNGNRRYTEQVPNAPVAISFAPAASSSYVSMDPPHAMSVDASELEPSMALSTTDALAALAGLANCMPTATSHGFDAHTQSAPSDRNGFYSGYAATGNSQHYVTTNGPEQGERYYQDSEKGWSASEYGTINGSAPLSSLVMARDLETNGNNNGQQKQVYAAGAPTDATQPPHQS